LTGYKKNLKVDTPENVKIQKFTALFLTTVLWNSNSFLLLK